MKVQASNDMDELTVVCYRTGTANSPLSGNETELVVGAKYKILGTNTEGGTTWLYQSNCNTDQVIQTIATHELDNYFMTEKELRKLKLQKLNAR